ISCLSSETLIGMDLFSLLDNRDSVAANINGLAKNSFTYKTLVYRIPRILASCVDTLCKIRDVYEERYEGQYKRVMNAIGEISKFRHEIATNKSMIPLDDDMKDVISWNQFFNAMRKIGGEVNLEWNYFSAPFIFVECYIYRRLNSIIWKETHHNDYPTIDIFMEHKLDGWNDSLSQMSSYCEEYLMKLLEGDVDYETLKKLIDMQLFGNFADQSFYKSQQTGISIGNKKDRNELILNDNSDALVQYLLKQLPSTNGKKTKQFQIHLILDNCGLELFLDLVFCDYILQKFPNSSITLHCKELPWFVSDVMVKDINFLFYLFQLTEHLNEDEIKNAKTQFNIMNRSHEKFDNLDKKCSKEIEMGRHCIFHSFDVEMFRNIRTVLNRISQQFINKRIKSTSHSFWTSANPIYRMKFENVDLIKSFGNTDMLLIFKGDLNYRKLVSDLDWLNGELPSFSSVTDFLVNSIKEIHPNTQVNLATIRVCKMDTIVGNLTEEQKRLLYYDEEGKERNEEQFIETAKEKTSSGKFGLIQFR
ncbi:hypothetical protein SNEBB_011150, partial [Seison nebaliae]